MSEHIDFEEYRKQTWELAMESARLFGENLALEELLRQEKDQSAFWYRKATALREELETTREELQGRNHEREK